MNIKQADSVSYVALKLFIILMLLSSFVFAENPASNTSIKGRVIDEYSKENIEYANVALYSVKNNRMVGAAVTGPNGEFTINSIKTGDYYLQVSFIGFKKLKTESLTINNNLKKKDIGVIELSASEQELDGVDVVGQKRSVQFKLDKQVVDPSTMASAAGGSAVDVLERTPSVTVDIEGNVKLRGSGSFQVLIDGRPTLLDPQMALEQMPVSQIQNIEIITNPSARYNADGDAGIINILTKKMEGQGITGLIQLNGSTVNSYGANVLIGFKKNNFSWRIGGVKSISNRVGDFDQIKETTVNDTLYHAESLGERIGTNYNTSAKVGFSFTQPKSSFDFDFEGGDRGFAYDGNLMFDEERFDIGEKYFEDSYTSHDMKDLNEDFITGSFAFNKWFDRKEHKLTGSLFATYGYSMEYFENDLTKGAEQIDGQKSWEEEFRVTVQGKLDYIKPLNNDKGKFEAGYELFYYVEDGDYGMVDYTPAVKDFVWQDDYYSIYRFERPVQSVYSILSNETGKFSYQAGIRGEYTHRVLETSTIGFTHTQNRFEFFPSGHLSYALENEQQFVASYSRRTIRPQLHFLEPYVTFADSYTARTGNPHVRPEYINSFEAGYQKYFGKENNFFSAQLFHRMKRDKIERIRTVYAPNITLDSISNVGNDFSSGLELMTNLTLYKWWSVDASASLFHYRIESDYKLQGVDEQSLNWEARFSNHFNLKSGVRIQFDGNYVGPSVSTQGTRKAFFYTNLSAKHQFLKKALTVSLSARDVLSTARFENTKVGEGLYSLTKVKSRSPLILLSLSYRINEIRALKGEGSSTDDLFEGAGH